MFAIPLDQLVAVQEKKVWILVQRRLITLIAAITGLILLLLTLIPGNASASSEGLPGVSPSADSSTRAPRSSASQPAATVASQPFSSPLNGVKAIVPKPSCHDYPDAGSGSGKDTFIHVCIKPVSASAERKNPVQQQSRRALNSLQALRAQAASPPLGVWGTSPECANIPGDGIVHGNRWEICTRSEQEFTATRKSAADPTVDEPVADISYHVILDSNVGLYTSNGQPSLPFDGIGNDADGTLNAAQAGTGWSYDPYIALDSATAVKSGSLDEAGWTISSATAECDACSDLSSVPLADRTPLPLLGTQGDGIPNNCLNCITPGLPPAYDLHTGNTGDSTIASLGSGQRRFEGAVTQLTFHLPDLELDVTYDYSLPPMRCDTVVVGTPGCVFPQTLPTLKYALTGPWADYPELALHIKEAQEGYGIPGMKDGAKVPDELIRLPSGSSEPNRAIACPRTGPSALPRPDGYTCDEYPFGSTLQGAASRQGYSCRMIDRGQNRDGGNVLQQFYRKQHVLGSADLANPALGDHFKVQIVGGPYEGSVTWAPNETKKCGYPVTAPPAPAPLIALDLSAANRRAPVAGLYDWSKAGYRQGGNLPTSSDFSTNTACHVTPAQMESTYSVVPDDGADDTTGIQHAIDTVKANCSPSAGYSQLSLIELPAGELDVSKQIYVDADYTVLRGAGGDPATGTKIVFTPDANTRYDQPTDDGTNWDKDKMISGAASGGWMWPGRGVFRVQSHAVHPDYASDYTSAPANRKDLFEGTVNVHWKVGAKLRQKPNDTLGSGFAARIGDTKIYLDNATNSKIRANLTAGAYVNIRAANTMNFYRQMKAVPTDFPLQNLTMRQQVFQITGVGTSSSDRWITINKPLEYDVPIDSTSDGSEPIPCNPDTNGGPCPTDPTPSKASPLVDPVVGVGIENLYLTQPNPDATPTAAMHNYGNMDPLTAINGIVLKWAVNDWIRGVHTYMTGSHPIVTEEAKNLTVINNNLDGAWNKGKGGNGYFRGSRVWDSLYAGNATRNLRHFTFQWSASGNVAVGNDVDSDLNLHGGWERNNLFENNTVTVPYEHRSASCFNNCGDEGNSGPDDSTWFPIWWAAGAKAVKWSGSSGPNNVFFNNTTKKQTTYAGDYTDYYPIHQTIYRFGWNGTGFQHLQTGGTAISDWAHNEQADYTNGNGVDATGSDAGSSLFLNQIPTS